MCILHVPFLNGFREYSRKKCMINPINNYNMNNVLEKDIYLDSSVLGQASGMKFPDSDKAFEIKISAADQASGLKKSVSNVAFGMKNSAVYRVGGLKSSAVSKHSCFPLYFGTLMLWFVLSLSLSSCQGGKQSAAWDEGDTIRLKYAQLLTMVEHEGFTEVNVGNPWKKGTVLHQYILIPKGKKGDETAEMLINGRNGNQDVAAGTSQAEAGSLGLTGPDGCRADIVRTPICSSAVFTSPHCQLLYELGCKNAIRGVCDSKYILIEDIQKRLGMIASASSESGSRKSSASSASGSGKSSLPIVDCGSGMQPDVEKIIALHPEALLISPFENSGGYGKLDNLNIPIIEAADYMENSPLGRAEWIKFYGLLFEANMADSLFAAIEKEYLALKAQAAKLPKGLSVLTERKMGSVWYSPGGKSTMGILLKDANARYIFAEDEHSGSLSLSPEQVIARGGEVDVCAFKYFGGQPLSRAALLQEYDGYKALRAFQTGNIYECNTDRIPYFEIVSFHPEIQLREFILLSHPQAKGLGALRFYRKM